MLRFAVFFIFFVLLGAGCDGRAPDRDRFGGVTSPPATGLALIMDAHNVGGHPITHTDMAYRWIFSTLLPPTFVDGRGTYLGPKPGESIDVQLGVAGTLDQDRDMFQKLDGLTNVDTGTLGAWNIVTAHDTKADRQVFRATLADPMTPNAYHVIECLAVTHSERNFWEGCRTFIEYANVVETVPNPVPAPTP